MYNGSNEHIENAALARIKALEKIEILKLKRIEDYNKNPKLCEYCNGPIAYLKKANRYCSSKCSAIVNNSKRIVTEEHKQKTSNSLKGIRKINGIIYKKIEDPICKICGNKFVYRTYKQICSKECVLKYRQSEQYKTLMRNKALERIQNGTHKGWLTREKLKPSYPEQYFISLFDNEKILYQREVKCGKYFIDFVVGKFAIEINGKQHEYEDRKLKDLEKDKILIDNGYEIIRIKWYNPSQKNKELLYEQTKSLLEKIK